MKERGILFSAPMVKALLAGTKAQTRRILNPKTQPWRNHYMEGGCQQSDWRPALGDDSDPAMWWWLSTHAAQEPIGKCPYGLAGDRLWVRETWRSFERPDDGIDGVLFFADGAFVEIPNTRAASDLWLEDHANGKHGEHWRPSIYMRRWASRLTLEVTEVRVQRLQEISEEDAKAEGVTLIGDVGCPCEGPKDDPGPHLPGCRFSHLDVDPDDEPYRASFAVLWDAINGKRAAWESNPWLWVISFKRLTP